MRITIAILTKNNISNNHNQNNLQQHGFDNHVSFTVVDFGPRSDAFLIQYIFLFNVTCYIETISNAFNCKCAKLIDVIQYS